jgi:hypothetical protein
MRSETEIFDEAGVPPGWRGTEQWWPRWNGAAHIVDAPLHGSATGHSETILPTRFLPCYRHTLLIIRAAFEARAIAEENGGHRSMWLHATRHVSTGAKCNTFALFSPVVTMRKYQTEFRFCSDAEPSTLKLSHAPTHEQPCAAVADAM